MSADEDLEIHQHGEPWEKACERMAVLGFAEPTGEESHADGDVLLGRTVFVNKLGEGRVIEFIPSMFGRPGQHKVRFSPKRGGAYGKFHKLTSPTRVHAPLSHGSFRRRSTRTWARACRDVAHLIVSHQLHGVTGGLSSH